MGKLLSEIIIRETESEILFHEALKSAVHDLDDKHSCAWNEAGGIPWCVEALRLLIFGPRYCGLPRKLRTHAKRPGIFQIDS
ncbi:hypothetical protein VSX64_15770 [Aurantimonas sp. C2-6-R+9]|uniref:hypothetical protein n=1 Tax=unclassified Aurantimonas TaxID=2638230 RepID=UPI002E1776F5|nr:MULTISPECIES: hypothetical protein [unclassified Aurantimonas]MEC5292226.1 hypothetical protein [Aurantimonas sp. C2-3-R2]MEC5382325.1 hypothetical protein [Aurantimonas sp. C2-6-R+9]MEC5413276.1 hypothetical protein [Aurantimonas sp. C2-4-R8]